MIRGLIIGKFMPLHRGHIALINFALDNCDQLIILVSANDKEPIPGPERLKWVRSAFADNENVLTEYTEEDLPDAPVSSRSVSLVWAKFLSARFPGVNLLFSSEKYGDYLAEYMGIKHKMFDLKRINLSISASDIRQEPFKNWSFIPEHIRYYFSKKICIYGAESTGKSTLTEKLAEHYQVGFVPELAREVLGKRGVDDLIFDDILKIGEAQAAAILAMEKKSQKLIFSDTDLITTCIYSRHYFKKVPKFPDWVKAVNKFDHYLFCESDVPWIRDVHRNLEHIQKKMRDRFETALVKRKNEYTIISGNWAQRLNRAISTIDSMWK